MKDFMNFVKSNSWLSHVLLSILTIIINFVLYKIASLILTKAINHGKSKALANKKLQTFIALITNVIRYIFIIITVLEILQIFGVNVSSMIAGVGVVGVIFGLAIQDWLKDIIRGSTIISDNYFSVGDIVRYKEIEGRVLEVGLKTTKIKDIKTSNVISIANRNIEQIQVVSDFLYITIPMPYEVLLNDAESISKEIVNDIKKNENAKEVNYLGVTDLGESYIDHLIEIKCDAALKRGVRRGALKSILSVFEKHEISVPYNQIDVHQK